MRHKWDECRPPLALPAGSECTCAVVLACMCVYICASQWGSNKRNSPAGCPCKYQHETFSFTLLGHTETENTPSLWETLTRSVLIKGLQPPQQVESCTGPRNDLKSSMLLSYYLITTNFRTLNRLKQTHKQRYKGDLSVLSCWARGRNGHPLIISVIFPPQWINLCLILTPFLWCVQRIYAAMEEYKFQ